VFVGENMDNDRDTVLIMADAPVTPTEIAGLGLDVIPASSNPGSSSDRRGETMEPSHGESERIDSNKIIVEIVSTLSTVVVTINILTGCHSATGTTSTFVSNVPAESIINDGCWDDPEWIKVVAGEVVQGIEGVDWVLDYATRTGPRQYGKLRRVGLPTHDSAIKLFTERRFLHSGQRLLEDRWDGRVLWNIKPDGPFVSGPGPDTLNL
jgi:hypothetical protein